jgi:16S rRNA (uracil1498-N3)-methyltransferase
VPKPATGNWQLATDVASHPDYPRTRLYCEQPLQANAAVALSRDQAHYVQHVLRLKTGDPVAAFNGRDGEWLAQVTSYSKSEAGLHTRRLLRPQQFSPDIYLLFAPIKGGKTETVIEKATELGVSVIQPVYTAHTVVTRLNDERLAKIAIEAAEQSERMDVPQVKAGMALKDALAGLNARILLFADESGGGENPATLLPRLFKAPAPALALLTGPEGGFSPQELTLLRQLPHAKAISLGPRILKADTAAVAALACVMALAGDWEHKPAFRSES